jgi:glycosyltransferase involved in cell wall biosynthesis
MKILFVNNFRGRGGGEEFLRDLLPGLVQKGMQIGLICRPNTPLAGMFTGTGVEVYPVRRSGIGSLSSVFTIAKIIRSRGYEVMSIQRGHDIIQSWVASLLSFRGIMLTYTVQVPEFLKYRFLLNRMDRITTISRYIAEKIANFAPSLAQRTSILYYGIDLGKFGPGTLSSGWLRNRFGLSPRTKIIATVGDLWKNQIEFLDALAEIRKTLPDVKYALVASETGIEQIREFKDRSVELGLSDAILWVGRLSKGDMLSFYADIDIALSTHRNEGFGIWVLEALAMGKPVVAFNQGGIRDSLEQCPAGVLVNGGAHEMAAAVVGILKNEAEWQEMSAAGRMWVTEKFSRDRMVNDYYRFFESLTRETTADTDQIG